MSLRMHFQNAILQSWIINTKWKINFTQVMSSDELLLSKIHFHKCGCEPQKTHRKVQLPYHNPSHSLIHSDILSYFCGVNKMINEKYVYVINEFTSYTFIVFSILTPFLKCNLYVRMIYRIIICTWRIFFNK